ncbi:MAG: DNA-binding response regulator [Bacteroidetes bacterium]|nr:MAG: DNA-binding response regulator [Bacteroidota bacterium]
MKILLIEDEPELARSIDSFFSKEHVLCEAVQTFEEAFEKVNLYQYDCIVVDITLPDGSGLDIIRQLKEIRSEAGIIIISAKNSMDDKITGLEIGADDYLTKPFHLPELNARVKSIIRRRQFNGDKIIQFDQIRIVPETGEVSVNHKPLVLTRKEYELLVFFIANNNRLLTKEAIAEHLWGDEMDQADSFDFIYTHIKNLRKKIQDKGGQDFIQTVYGMGYKFSGQ